MSIFIACKHMCRAVHACTDCICHQEYFPMNVRNLKSQYMEVGTYFMMHLYAPGDLSFA